MLTSWFEKACFILNPRNMFLFCCFFSIFPDVQYMYQLRYSSITITFFSVFSPDLSSLMALISCPTCLLCPILLFSAQFYSVCYIPALFYLFFFTCSVLFCSAFIYSVCLLRCLLALHSYFPGFVQRKEMRKPGWLFLMWEPVSHILEKKKKDRTNSCCITWITCYFLSVDKWLIMIN